jgi:hypothetical protein
MVRGLPTSLLLLAASATTVVAAFARVLDRRAKRREVAEPAPAPMPIEEVARHVRRLGREVDLHAAGTLRVSAVKQLTLLNLYDERLAQACEALGLPQSLCEVGGMEREFERVRVELALTEAGLRLR